MSDRTASYADLSAQFFGYCIEALAASNQRFLGYWKSVAEVAARPYAVASLEDVMRENAERSTSLIDLTVKEVEHAGEFVTGFAKKFVELAYRAQEQGTAAARGLYETGASNLNFVKNSATKFGKLST